MSRFLLWLLALLLVSLGPLPGQGIALAEGQRDSASCLDCCEPGSSDCGATLDACARICSAAILPIAVTDIPDCEVGLAETRPVPPLLSTVEGPRPPPPRPSQERL